MKFTKSKLKKQNKEIFFDLILKQQAQINTKRIEIESLLLKNTELKDKLAKNSQNSSKPPSTDGYEKPAPKTRASYFNQYHFISYERLAEVFKDCHALSISKGSFANFNQKCSENVAPTMTAIKEILTTEKVLQLDESGMHINKKLHWLHVASNDKATYYEMHARRGQEAIDAINILPQCKGAVVHDHWKPYLNYKHCQHGLCNAHHKRRC